MLLKQLLEVLNPIETHGNLEREVPSIASDSRKCEEGSLFIALQGAASDGHQYLPQALERGAKVIVYERSEAYQPELENITWIRVPDGRNALAALADAFYDHPSRRLRLVGVTGTNGKTTIATLLYRLFRGLGYECGLLSTIANYVGTQRYETENTTPDPITLNALLHEMTLKGCEFAFMEVSSHALEQRRTAGLTFTGGIFTNLTHDHLDYHKTFAEYIRCKKIFFDNLPKTAFALTNADDRNGNIVVQNTAARIYHYAARTPGDFKVRIVEKSLEGSLLNIDGTEVWTRFIGAHNAYNLLAVYATALLLGANRDEVLAQMSALQAVSGRLEYVRGGNDLTAVVDYAHTPDALENVLKTLKEITGNERPLVCIFGCGGNRDKTKRPEMAAVAEKYADRIVITSDNPRFEDPEAIIADIQAGLSVQGRQKTVTLIDRAEAIRSTLLFATPGSLILIAGKGHEDYQIIQGTKHYFDDLALVRECLTPNN
ncbi:MAG: UDP-N-acetylmuramoyl-L-alanyl-D-glutamate--2,6-diaminopimelate ligase [Bacteroidales bacterium]|nr:UDP-N-acetylmuramoyl-L-alanyl-D-glutamate--2,6-diaminopimelate ligase [Bacteroidales bacterium]